MDGYGYCHEVGRQDTGACDVWNVVKLVRTTKRSRISQDVQKPILVFLHYPQPPLPSKPVAWMRMKLIALFIIAAVPAALGIRPCRAGLKYCAATLQGMGMCSLRITLLSLTVYRI
ncbi:hypothetical protein BJX96DRAFT_144619 [Aspergillus floccosus]